MARSKKYRSQTSGYMVKYNKLYRAGYRTSVPAFRAERRLQALMAIGYGANDVAARIPGMAPEHLRELCRGGRTVVYLKTFKKIDAVYQELYRFPNEALGAKRVKTWARKSKYAPPFAWNDIDDPNDTPEGVEWKIPRCMVSGCSRKQEKREWCEKHYQSEYLNKKAAA